MVKESKSNSMKVRCWTIYLYQNKTASTKMFALLSASLFLVLLLFWVSVVVICYYQNRIKHVYQYIDEKEPHF